MMLNFGVWGPGLKKRDEFVKWNRAFEKKVRDLGGQKWLYAHTYYTEQEFDEIYNREIYDGLREKYYVSPAPTRTSLLRYLNPNVQSPMSISRT
jgi:delta24-sterol reductase